MRRPLLPIVVLALALAAPACSKKEAEPAEEAAATKTDEATPPEAKKEEKEPVQEADPNEACLKILVVAHSGLDEDQQPEGADKLRDKPAAEAHAKALLAKLEAGESFESLVLSDSDDERTKAKRGGTGTFTRDAWPERYEPLKEPIFGLPIAGRTAVLDTPIGLVIAERCAVDKVHTRHILLRYAGAKRADDDVKRSRDEAKAEAEAVRAMIAGGQDFAEVAKDKGEDGTAERGGDLGPIGRGMFAYAYEEAAWSLKPGELSPVVETDFGFHVIERLADEADKEKEAEAEKEKEKEKKEEG